MRAMTLVGVLLGCVLCACGSAKSTVDTQAAPAGRPSPNVLTESQLVATNSDNLYDAIAKLHPDWLSSRGPTSVTDATPTSASVFMGGSLLGRAEALRDMRVIDVTEVRYWDAGRAAARFGMGHPRGVIELTRK
jgi:hypothetical protein